MSYKKFYKKGGVTISGGEPMLQHEFLFEFLGALNALGFHSAIDTNGFIDLKFSQKCIERANMLLLDIKEVNNDDCIKLTEYGNENALKTLRILRGHTENACGFALYVCQILH